MTYTITLKGPKKFKMEWDVSADEALKMIATKNTKKPRVLKQIDGVDLIESASDLVLIAAYEFGKKYDDDTAVPFEFFGEYFKQTQSRRCTTIRRLVEKVERAGHVVITNGNSYKVTEAGVKVLQEMLDVI